MAEPTKNGVKVTVEIWVDDGEIMVTSDDPDFGPKGLIGSFKEKAATQHARELLQKHGKLPA